MAILPGFSSRRRFIILGGLVILGLASLGIRQLSGRAPPAQSGTAETATPVTAGTAVRRDFPDSVNALGTVRSIDSVAIQPRVTGAITKVEFSPGQDVKKGQELFLIDPRPYQAALDQAKAQLAHDEAVLQEAEVDLTRYQTLEKEKSIAGQQAQDQAYVVQQDKGTVALDHANVETAQLNLDYCHIAAPIAGRAGALLVDLGNLVGPQSGQSASASGASGSSGSSQTSSSNTLALIAQLQPIYVDFSVAQALLQEILRNQAAGALEADAYSQTGKLLEKGQVTLIDNQVNAATGTVMLQATFTNAGNVLWPGEFVRIKLIVAIMHNVVTVPAAAVMAGANGSYVYVIGPDSKVNRATVEVAARHGGVAVISKGLSGGEKIVTDGQYRLANGMRVAIQPAQPGASSAQKQISEQ
ncbi:MAG TPA: efflux RND transporter periplasmic adaptor subunit [Xanthobacteraceae bacterium]|nr:efflux RND transporter periplasmic adaptor subunit [Xanthobacteraceae bacterium]